MLSCSNQIFGHGANCTDLILTSSLFDLHRQSFLFALEANLFTVQFSHRSIDHALVFSHDFFQRLFFTHYVTHLANSILCGIVQLHVIGIERGATSRATLVVEPQPLGPVGSRFQSRLFGTNESSEIALESARFASDALHRLVRGNDLTQHSSESQL
jgi:hypothetical protein